MASGEPRPTSPGASSSRVRLIYCTIGTVILCAGIITLIAGIVVFILTSTPSSSGSSSTYMSDIFYFQSQNSENRIDQTSIIVAIVLGSVGISFICLSFVFAMLACFAGDNEVPRPQAATFMKQQDGNLHYVEGEDDVAPMIARSASLKQMPQGDINTVGLPSMAPSTRSRVPPNGFSYLADPSEIQHFCDHRSMPVRNQRYKITELANSRESAI